MEKRRMFIQNNLPLIIGIFCLSLFNCITVKNAISSAYVPDELYFYDNAITSHENKTFSQNLFHGNDFGYGGLWWTVYVFVVKGFEGVIDYSDEGFQNVLQAKETLPFIDKDIHFLSPIISMRLISLMMLNFVFIFILVESFRRKAFLVGFFVLLLSPMVYWSGKLASPEIPAAVMMFFSTYFLLLKRRYELALFFAFLGVGLKPSALPLLVSVGAFTVYLTVKEKQLSSAFVLKCLVASCCGFLVSNPFALIDPRGFIDALSGATSTLRWDLPFDFSQMLDRVLSFNGYTWDGTPYGGLGYWSIGLVPLTALVVVCFICSDSKLCVCFVSLSLLLFVSFMGLVQTIHHWYLFPVILVYPFLFLDFKKDISIVLLLALLPYIVWLQVPKIVNELTIKYRHIENIKHFEAVNAWVYDEILRLKLSPKRVFNLSEIGLSLKNIPSELYYNFHDSFVFSGAFKTGDLLILGDRTKMLHPFLEHRFISTKEEQILKARHQFVSLYYIN